MDAARICELRSLYEHTLFDDVIPFWMEHSPDREHGGYFTLLGADGKPYGTDKYMWPQARETWFFSTLCDMVEPRREWLDMARLGWEFIVRHAFHESGHAYFSFTRDGTPLSMPRKLFSETFIIIAAVRYHRVTGDPEAARIARTLFRLVAKLMDTPAAGSQKAIPGARPMSDHAVPMIMLNVIREMTLLDGPTDELVELADRCLRRVLDLHVHPGRRLLFEQVAPDGSLMLDVPEGRLILPGHAIESAWFLMQEGEARGDGELIDRACELTLWMLDFGWDKDFGGLFYFLDSEGHQALPLEWDMKLWWCHNEAMYALLLAMKLRGGAVYEEWYERVHEYAFTHHPDPHHGEWFGYLHRDGTISHRFKGNAWKCCFHLPRMLLFGWLLLDGMERGR